MSSSATTRGAPIGGRDDLIRHLEIGCRPGTEWRIGTEHEKFVFRRADRRPVPYDGEAGIRALLEGVAARGWDIVSENGRPIALVKDKASVSLEPAGQFELSGAPLATLHQTAAELDAHLGDARAVGEALGLGFLGLGFTPDWRRDEMEWMPKGRYGIMKAYMPKQGQLGLDMMTRTCTVQVNLDFADEADMVAKFRASLALQPVATALFASSPFTEGKPNGFQSYRSHIWTDTDPDRSGILPFVFEDGFGFERYAEYALDVPMYFVYRDGAYVDASGLSFRDFLDGRLPVLPGERPMMGDWADHLTTLFPEVRLKSYLEMRGADAGPRGHLMALPAFWVGLLYDPAARAAAWDLAKRWSVEDVLALRRDVPRQGLEARIQGHRLQDIAREAVAIARTGLRARVQHDAAGRDESVYLDPIAEIAETGRTLATVMLERYESAWGRRVDPVYEEFAF